MKDVIQVWEETYSATYRRMMERYPDAASMPRPILGFHTTIDGLKRIVPEQVEAVLDADPELAREVKARVEAGDVPDEILSVADLLVGMLVSVSKGKALQRMIRNSAVHEWCLAALGYDRLRAGGTCGNMVSMLAPLGFEQILLYVNPLTREQAELLPPHENVKVIVAEEGADGAASYRLTTPAKAWREEGVKAVHWIFEYPEGMRICAGGIDVRAPRANRYIAAYNPVNNQLVINRHFKAGLLELIESGERFTHFIIAGFHILSERYPDGSCCRDCLRPLAEFVSKVKEKAPGLKLHCELASIGGKAVRCGVMELALPISHSLGLNEVELATLLGDLEEHELRAELERTEAPPAVFEGVAAAGERLGLARIHLHNLGYYLCLTRSEFVDAQNTRDGLVFAACAAAARTVSGSLVSLEDVERGLDVPVSERGLKACRELADYLGYAELVETGMAQARGWNVTFVPTKVVEKPVLTVGLGDLISSSSFLLGT